jgi:hypothetical protein
LPNAKFNCRGPATTSHPGTGLIGRRLKRRVKPRIRAASFQFCHLTRSFVTPPAMAFKVAQPQPKPSPQQRRAWRTQLSVANHSDDASSDVRNPASCRTHRPFAVLPGFPAGRQLGYQVVGKPSRTRLTASGGVVRSLGREPASRARSPGRADDEGAGRPERDPERLTAEARSSYDRAPGGRTWLTGFVAMGGRRSFPARAVMPEGTSHNGKLPVPGGEPVFGIRARATWSWRRSG